jgi:hypothetical protein
VVAAAHCCHLNLLNHTMACRQLRAAFSSATQYNHSRKLTCGLMGWLAAVTVQLCQNEPAVDCLFNSHPRRKSILGCQMHLLRKNRTRTT